MDGGKMKSVLVVILSLAVQFVYADPQVDPGYYEIGSVEINEVADSIPVQSRISLSNKPAVTSGPIGSANCKLDNSLPAANSKSLKNSILRNSFATKSGLENVSPTPELDMVDVAVDKIINIGKKIWKVVEAGKPVVNLTTDVGSALPSAGSDLCWMEMENWLPPQSKVYHMVIKNLYGMEVINVKYRVLYIAGGSYNGIGKYIGYAAIQPSEVSVSWGFTMSLNASVPVVVNIGTKTNPVAGMNLQVDVNIKSPIKEIHSSQVFFISGNGNIQEIQ